MDFKFFFGLDTSKNMEEGAGRTKEVSKRKFVSISSGASAEEGDEDNQIISAEEDTVHIQIAALDESINGRYGTVKRLEELEAQVADITNDYCEIKAENQKLKGEMELLKSMMIKKDLEISNLKTAVVDQRSWSMRSG